MKSKEKVQASNLGCRLPFIELWAPDPDDIVDASNADKHFFLLGVKRREDTSQLVYSQAFEQLETHRMERQRVHPGRKPSLACPGLAGRARNGNVVVCDGPRGDDTTGCRAEVMDLEVRCLAVGDGVNERGGETVQ